MKRAKLRNKPITKLDKAKGDETVRKIYNVKANYVNSAYLSIIEDGAQIRLTFNEDMALNDGKFDRNPVCAVVMSLDNFQKLYTMSTGTLQLLRTQKKVP